MSEFAHTFSSLSSKISMALRAVTSGRQWVLNLKYDTAMVQHGGHGVSQVRAVQNSTVYVGPLRPGPPRSGLSRPGLYPNQMPGKKLRISAGTAEPDFSKRIAIANATELVPRTAIVKQGERPLPITN
ncbi:hypothetical protein CRM22_008964, partial [Opisthorchis felineus]